MQLFLPQLLAQLRQGYGEGRAQFVELPEEPDAALVSEEAGRVDVVVPVYKGFDETIACIASVLSARDDTAMELVVINDASPDAKLTEALRRLAAKERLTLIENPQNLGFVATVNCSMRLHPARDVVLLNPDTPVAPGWLARLKQAAHAVARQSLDVVLCGDVESLADAVLEDFIGEPPDLLVFGDVLEHLRDPLAVLRRLVGRLAPGGRWWPVFPMSRIGRCWTACCGVIGPIRIRGCSIARICFF